MVNIKKYNVDQLTPINKYVYHDTYNKHTIFGIDSVSMWIK